MASNRAAGDFGSTNRRSRREFPFDSAMKNSELRIQNSESDPSLRSDIFNSQFFRRIAVYNCVVAALMLHRVLKTSQGRVGMIARVSLIAVALFGLAGVLPAADRPAPTAIVLCYHVVESPYDTEFSITRETFVQQMQYLAATGYNVISLADLSDYVAGRRKSLPENAVVVTVDDGYRSVYDELFPVMKKHKFPFTVFVYPKFIGQSAYALTWKQIREMADEGALIESHTLSHGFLTRNRHRSLDDAAYRDWLDQELVRSKEIIEAETGRKVRFLAYPYGDYSEDVARSAAEAGYDAGLTCDFGPVRPASDLFRMKRVVIRKDTSFAEFRRLLGNGSLTLEEPSPSPGDVFTSHSPVVSAKIANFEDLEPNSVQMAVLSLGTTPYAYDPRDGSISMVVRDSLEDNLQRAFVWGTDRKTGKRVEASWNFYAKRRPPAATVRNVTPPKAVPGVPVEGPTTNPSSPASRPKDAPSVTTEGNRKR
jgi:peptidoglycan/xylan/chitin deacetylase (PgdA/CDA1 family)